MTTLGGVPVDFLNGIPGPNAKVLTGFDDWLEEGSDVDDSGKGVSGSDSGVGSVEVLGTVEPVVLHGGKPLVQEVRIGMDREKSPVVTPVCESLSQEVERRTKEVCDQDPEANADAVRPHVEMLVKNERRRRAAEQAEGAAREESPDYDTGSQEVRRGRRRG